MGGIIDLGFKPRYYGDTPQNRINELERKIAAKDAEIKQLGAELQKMERTHVSELAAKNREIEALKAEVERLKAAEHHLIGLNHGRNHEMIQRLERENTSLREQVSRLSAPLTHKEWKKNFILNATDDVYSEDKDGFDGVIAARLEGK